MRSLFHLLRIRYNYFEKPILWQTYCKFLSVWLISLIINLLCRKLFHLDIDTPSIFPFSMFYFHFSITGLLFFLLFMMIIHIVYQTKFYQKSIMALWLSALIMIVTANLIQGSFHLTFVEPIIAEKVSYYYDAVNIVNWHNFITSFNGIQAGLHTHSMTHPPGAVLLYLICMLNKSAISISLLFTIISSFSIILIYYIFKEIGLDNNKSYFFALLYSVIPSFNIYALASFDAVVLVFMNLFLLGLIKIIKKDNLTPIGLMLMSAGILITSALTFAVVFIFGVLMFLSLYYISKKKTVIFIASLIIVFLELVFYFLLYKILNFNYLQSFVLATKLENPHGFLLSANPAQYILSRIEDMLEILIFISLPVLVAIRDNKTYKNIKKDIMIISITAFTVLIIEFLTGAYRTGETARACVFIITYIILLISDLDSNIYGQVIVLTALQTGLMQLIGNYYW